MATGKRLPEVAKEYGVSKATFYRVVNNEVNSPRVQQIISGLINKPVDEIWTDQQHHQEQVEQQNA